MRCAARQGKKGANSRHSDRDRSAAHFHSLGQFMDSQLTLTLPRNLTDVWAINCAIAGDRIAENSKATVQNAHGLFSKRTGIASMYEYFFSFK